MKKQTILAETIDVTAQRAKYDECAKKLISQKVILAFILKYCTTEFAPYSVEYIMNGCIEGEPKIASKAVHRDQPDADIVPDTAIGGNESIKGLNTEDGSIMEHTVTYDIRFQACLPESGRTVELIINIEIQVDDTPGYPIVKRGFYYCSRMISSQYGTVFTDEHYEKLQKVYSIWICPSPAKKRRNSIRKYGIGETVVLGDVKEEKSDYDLMEVVLVHLGEAGEESGNEAVDLLNVLLSAETTPDEKKRILHEEYRIAMTTELESGVQHMCNLSEAIWQRGIEQGIERGIEQGIERGVEQGRLGMLFDLVRNNLLSVKDAALQADLTEECFKEKMRGSVK